MKKIIPLLLALLLIIGMTVPAYAVTPPLDTPASQTVPEIEVDVELPDEFWDNYFEEHPLPEIEITEPTEAPTEPPADTEQSAPDWCEWLNGWRQWWREVFANGCTFAR